jgi:glycosyltransferase involved in cell wall biosynthesis
MRIAAISNSRVPSATANSIQAMKMCDALAQIGHEVRLLVPAEQARDDGPDLDQHYGIVHRFEVEWLPSRRGLRRLDFVWLAARRARAMGAELIYTWLPQTAAIEAWWGRPVVLEMHADVAGRFGAWWLGQALRSPRTRLLVTTAALRRALERSTRMSFDDDAVQVAPNGVDLERYENLPDAVSARAALRLPEGATIGFTGHFYAGRGVEMLFELARGLPQLRWLWVGGTSEAVKLWRDRVEAAGLSNVTLTGFVDQNRLPLYQAASDVLLMPYQRSVAASSGQDIAEVINPMKMFEYMAVRRPIITADLPVIREVLDETRAVFCAAGDVDGWRRSILELAEDSDRRRRLAESARREVERHTWIRRAERAVENLPLQ